MNTTHIYTDKEYPDIEKKDEEKCSNIDIEVIKTILELPGQTYAIPEHYIQYRCNINDKNKDLSKELVKGKIIIALSFRPSEESPLIEHKFIVNRKSDSQYKDIEEFIECVKSSLIQQLWKYAKKIDDKQTKIKTIKISIPESMILGDNNLVIYEYHVSCSNDCSHPATAAVITYILLHMLKKFLTQLSRFSWLSSLDDVGIKFEKKIIVYSTRKDSTSGKYIDIEVDNIKKIEDEIKSITSQAEIIKNIENNPSIISYSNSIIVKKVQKVL